MYRTVMWASDGSPGADEALVAARGLASADDARLIAMHCDQRIYMRGNWPYLPDEDDRLGQIEAQVASLQGDGIDAELVVRHTSRDAAEVAAEVAAEHGVDVIVCGTRGLGSLSGAVLGSFTQRLLHVAPCPVLVVPRRQAVAAKAPETAASR